MPVDDIRARIKCDGCGILFTVAIDRGQDIPAGWDLDDLAIDALRGGYCYHEIARGRSLYDKQPLGGLCSVQAEQLLCPACTRKCDELCDEDGKEIDRNLTADEVKRALES